MWSTRRFAVAMFAGAVLTPVLAQDASGAGKPVLTRDELRICLAQQDELDARRDQLESERRALERERTVLSHDKAGLDAEKDALKTSERSAVQAYNERAQALDVRVVAWNGRSDEFSRRVHSLDVERHAWSGHCANRRLRADDEAAIRSGK